MKCIIRADVLNRVRVALSALLVAVTSVGAQAQLDCRADINGSRAVDAVDLCMLIDGWGGASHDLNGDGIVNSFDIAQLLNSWGPCAYSTELIGRVVFANGKGVSGVSVTSSLGGSATTSGSGAFAFPIEFAWLTNSATVTAIASIGGVEYTGSKSVTPLVSGGQSDVGDIVLASDCVPEFTTRFGGYPGVSFGPLFEAAPYTEALKPEVVVWGDITVAGSSPVLGMAAFDGVSWRPFGTGLYLANALQSNGVLAVINGELIAGGRFDRLNAPLTAGGASADRLARWDRATSRWVGYPSLPPGPTGQVLGVVSFDFNDGHGERLVVLCAKAANSGLQTPQVFQLLGGSWQSVGTLPMDQVNAMAVATVGGVRRLIVASDSSDPLNQVVEWTSMGWQSLPAIPTALGSVYAMTGFDGSLFLANSAGVAEWNSVSWIPSPTAVGGRDGLCFTVARLNGIPKLVLGTARGSVSPQRTAFVRSGGVWEPLGESPTGGTPAAAIGAIAALSVGTDDLVFAGGSFSTVSGQDVPGAAVYEDGGWHPAGRGLAGTVTSIVSRTEGGQAVWYVGGDFSSADGVVLNGVARWDGTRFNQLGTGRPGTRALCFHDAGDGQGERLYAASGNTTSIARWTGSGWQEIVAEELGFPPNYRVQTLCSIADGTGNRDLYVGGTFPGGVARWRNGTAWEPVGDGLNQVRVIGQHEVAGVRSIYAGGDFQPNNINRIARLNQQTNAWEPLGQGLGAPENPFVESILSFQGKLYAAGGITRVEGTSIVAYGVAVWDGMSWSALVSDTGQVGPAGPVRALAVLDLGTGPSLYAGGVFEYAYGETPLPMQNLARWNGRRWLPAILPGQLPGQVRQLLPFERADGTKGLIIGGEFRNSAAGDSGMAEWSCN